MRITLAKFSKELGAFIAVLFLTILIMASVNSLSMHTLSESTQSYMPRFPSMLRSWQTITLEGRPLGKPESYGSYVAYLYESYGRPILSIVDIITGEKVVHYPIEVPSYLGSTLSIISSRISWFSWNYYGEDITGLVIILCFEDNNGVLRSLIISIPDVFGLTHPFNALYIPSSGVVKGLVVHNKTLFVLESSAVGRYSLRAIDLVSGETLWTFLNSEFVTPDWKLIEDHYTRFMSLPEEKDVWDLYNNYAIIYKPLYEALYSLEHTVIYSNGKLFVPLPFGPPLVVNATEGTLIEGDLNSFGWTLSTSPDIGIVKEILYPVAIKYTTSTGDEYIATFSVIANYADIIGDYMNRTINAPVGDLRGHLKITIYSGSTGEALSELDITNMTEISDTIRYSISSISPMTSLYVKDFSPAIFAQGLAYNYSWIFGTNIYVQGSELNIEDSIASLSPPQMNEPERPVMYLFTANQASIMSSFSKISLNKGDEVLKAFAFRALGYKTYYYINDGNETYADINMREIILTIRKNGMFAYGVSESQDTPGIAELNLLWAWSGYTPLDIIKIGDTVWGIVEENNGTYVLRITSPIYISAGSPSLGELGGTLNTLEMGFSFYDYLTGEWLPYLPRHLWGHIYYLMPNGEVFSLEANTTILLTSPGVNTIRAMMLFNETLEASTDNLSREFLTKILLFDTGIADESFADIYVLAKNYWPSKYGGLESYNFAYAFIPKITELDVFEVENISVGNERIVGVISSGPNIYAISAGDSVSHVYVISPNKMSSVESIKIEGKIISAAVFMDRLFILTSDGTLYEYDGNNITFCTYLPWIGETAILETSSSGLYVFDNESSTLAKLDGSGKIVWTYSFEAPPKAFTYGLGHIFVIDNAGTIYAIYDQDGTTTWKRAIGETGDIKYILIPHSEEYSGASYLILITYDGNLLVISPIDGSTILEKSIFKISTERLCGNAIYAPTAAKLYVTSNYYIYEVDAKSLSARELLIMPPEVRNNSTRIEGPIANNDTLFLLMKPNGRVLAVKILENTVFYNVINTSIASSENILLREPFIVVSNETGVYLIGIVPIQVIEKSPENLVINPGEEARITVMVRDMYGNPVSNAQIAIEAPSEILIPDKNITTDENGVATITLTGYKAGEYKVVIRADIKGEEYSVEEIIRILPGEPAYVEIELKQTSVYAGEPIAIIAKVKDYYGNPIEGINVEAYATYGEVSPNTAITDVNGETIFTYMSKTAGVDVITIKVSGYSIYATKTLEILPGEPYTVEISGDSEGILGGAYTAEISVFDKYGNAVKAGYEFDIYVDSEYVTTVTTNSYGKTIFTYTFTDVGTHTIKVVWKENSDVQGIASLNVIYGPPAKIIVEDITLELKAGETFKATLVVLNQYGYPIPGSEIDVYVDERYVETVVTDSDGKAYVTTVTTTSGIHTLKVVTAQDPNVYKLVSFRVLPSDELSLTASLNKKEIVAGEELVITMVLTDAYGNPLTRTLVVHIGNFTDTCVVGSEPVKYKTTITKAGTYNVVIEYEGKVLFSDVLVVRPSAPAKIIALRNITSEAGQRMEVVVKVYDEYDNPVPQVGIFAINISNAPAPYSYYTVTDDEGKAVLVFNITTAGTYQIGVYIEEKPEIFTTIAVTILPGRVDKIAYLGPDKIYAGTRVEISFVALDKYDNPAFSEKIEIYAPEELTLADVPLTTDNEGRASFYVYGEKIGKYTITIVFPRYNQSYYINLTILPAEEKIIIIDVDRTTVKPGEDIVVTYTLLDKFGNPIVDAIPQLKYEGFDVIIKSITPSDSAGVGYIVVTAQSKGFGRVYVDYEGYVSNPIEIVSGNPTLLKIENWIATYWYVLIILAVIIIFGVLFAIYIRTLWKLRRIT